MTSRMKAGQKTVQQGSLNYMIDFIAFFCIVCRLGFPGNLGKMFSESLTQMIGYASSVLQLILIFLASGDTLLEIKVLELKRKYIPVYMLLITVLLVSLAGVNNRGEMLSTYLRFLLTALFGLWLADHYTVERLLELIYGAFVVFVISNLLMLTVFRGHGYYFDEEGRYLFCGIAERKNALGEELAHGILLLGALLRIKTENKKRPSRLFFLTLFAQVFMLIITQAVGSLFTAIVPFIYLICYDRIAGFKRRINWGITYSVISTGFVVFALTILPVLAPLLETLGKDATLSNRTTIWEGVIEFMTEGHTFTGYGLLQFWNDPAALRSLQNHFQRNSWFRTMTYGSHNVLLEMWLDIGLVGIVAYLATMLRCFSHPEKMKKYEYLTISAIVFPLMIRGLTERCYSNANYTTLLFFCALGLGCNWREQKYFNAKQQLSWMNENHLSSTKGGFS